MGKLKISDLPDMPISRGRRSLVRICLWPGAELDSRRAVGNILAVLETHDGIGFKRTLLHAVTTKFQNGEIWITS